MKIEIKQNQKQWLANMASTVGDNTKPVKLSEGVEPQHLIGVARDLLQNTDVDRYEVRR